MLRFTPPPLPFLKSTARLLVLFAFLLCPLFASAQDAEKPADEYLISADEMENDEAAGSIKAKGSVLINGKDQKLLADEVEFNQKRETVLAAGKVSVIESDGTVMFADRTEMSSDMKEGYANNVGMIMPDNSRLAARDARRSKDNYTVFSKGMYSPCNLCKENPRKAPLWQLKAVRTTHDKEKKDLIYRDATLEMFGVPMLYTPYFTHPDPTVKRRQGFLTPSYGRNEEIGHFVRMPYYFDIAPDLDYTFVPTFNGDDGMRWAGKLRKRFEKGSIEINHAMAIADRTDADGITKKDQIRGHLFGNARYDLSNIFRVGADYALLTDINAMRRYSQSVDDVLENRVYLEGFKGRDYTSLEFFHFQDNRPFPRSEQPLVMPRFSFFAFGEPDSMLGGRWSVDGTVTALRRDVGADTNKIASTFGWERRDVLPMGAVTTLRANVRNDFFYVDNLADPTTPGRTFNGDATNRLFPEGQVMVSYPLAEDFGFVSHIIEPIAAITASPTLAQNDRIPNEDSLDVEFDTTNLFEISRYPGSDQAEQGARVTYGLKNSFYAGKTTHVELMFGQNYRLTPDPLFPVGSGLETDMSDYVGQIKAVPGTWANMDYFFRLDKDGLNFRKHDVVADFGILEFRPRFRYTNIDPPAIVPGGIGRVEELIFGFSSRFADYWTFSAQQTRDLRPATAGPRTSTATLSYVDECFTSSFSFVRDHTVRTGVKSGDTFLFRIFFKNLGGIDGGDD